MARPEDRSRKRPSAIGASKSATSTSLLKKEFKPKTDEAKEAVERAVRTLAEQALSQTRVDQRRRRQVDRGDHRPARQEAHRADQPDPAPRGLPEARRRLARPALPRQQHRNGRDAEDPFPEHQQGRPRQDPETLQGDRLGSEPAVQEDLRGGVRPVRRRALRLPGRRLLLRPDAAGRGAAGRDGADRGRRAHAVHRRRVADGHADVVVAGAGQPAGSDQDLHARRNTRRGGRCASPRTPATRPGDAALPVAAAVRREDQPGRGLRVRGGHRRRPITAATRGPTPPTRWRRTSTARSSCTAGARASAASSPAARSRACRSTPSRPTTAAWT